MATLAVAVIAADPMTAAATSSLAIGSADRYDQDRGENTECMLQVAHENPKDPPDLTRRYTMHTR
jgi:hypothetical protein